MLKTTLLFFFVISLASSFEINSPTFIHLTQGVYEFQINGGQMPYEFSVSGLPKGIILDNNKLILQQIVATGQYILSVKASDSSGKLDEKIIILDIDSSSNNMLHRKTTTISNSQSIKTNSPLSVPTITSIKQANINPSIPTISSISNSQSNQQGNQKISFSVQQTSSASQNLANKGSTGQNNIPSQTKIDEGLTISNLKSLFGDTKTLQITTTSSTNSKNSANGNIDFDLTSLSSNNPQSIDFGGTLDLTNKYNISHLNSFFNDINVENSGQSSGITTKTTKTNLNDILSSFSTSDSVSNFSQQIKVDGKDINQNIQTKSYKFDLKDSDMIDDEQAFKLFDAQKIAANYVATNFSIVQQMSGNKKTIYDLMMNLSANYESLQQSYKTVMVDLNIAATNKSKIQSAISNMNAHINSVTSQIDISNNRRLSLSSQRITLLNKNNQSELQAVQIKQNIDLLNQQLLIVNNSLNNNADSCSKVNQNLIQTDQNITVSNSQLGMINQQLATNSQDVISKQQIVEDLMRRLAIAQRQLSQAQSKSNTLNKQKSDIQQRISTLNQNLITLRSSQATCNSQLPTIRQNIIIINADIQSNITALRNLGGTKEDRINQIAILQNQINQESSKREELIIQKQNAGNALILLQNALPSASNTLNLLISQKSQFQFKLQSEERNLKQTIVKFKEYERKLQFAIMDLQNARAISQQADQAVNAMLARKKNILPYAIGVQSLSTALIGQTVINNNINISNWFNFLSANFGGNLVQYSNQNIQCLYPFNLTSSLQNNIQCPLDADNLKCYSGKIELIKNSYNLMIVSDDTGIMIQLQIPTCATLHSNIINYKFKVGDSVIIKAVPKKDRIFIAKKLLCLRH